VIDVDKGSGAPPAVIALAASAGGVEALTRVVGGLPKDLPAAVLVVLHIAPVGPSVLPSIIARQGKLPAIHPSDGDPLVAGCVYVAPPDFHLTVTRERARVSAGPRENGNRPAADPLFRSVAAEFGPKGAGVVLSGSLDDGTAGLAAVKRAGGLTVVQDPEEAAFPSMPASAAAYVHPDHVVPLDEIAGILVDFAKRIASGEPSGRDVGAGRTNMSEDQYVDPPSAITCPDCGGTLWVTSDAPMRFRCRVGHAFSPEALLIGKQDTLENAIWAAIVALQERAELSRRLIRRLGPDGPERLRSRYVREIAENRRRAELLERLAVQLIGPVDTTAEEAVLDEAPEHD
jgi:two-component system chemotaxis response regulator CheB